MGHHTTVKTTIEIADDLAEQAKRLALARGITFNAVIEEGIRLTLRAEENATGFKLRDAAVPGKGLQPEFRNATWADIRDTMYRDCGN